MLYSIVGILVIILDQVVKFWVERNITNENPIIQLIPNVLSIVKVQNDGAAFSILSGGSARIWFIILTGVFALAVVLALATNFISGKFGRWCLVLVTAGGISNCLDRVLYGYVVDMFKVELFNFAVFNVADIFITVFCVAFILYILFGGEKELEPDADEFDEEDVEISRPVKKASAPKKRAVVPVEDDDEDEEDYVPVKRSVKKAASRNEAAERASISRKSMEAHTTNPKAAKSNDEFESFFAQSQTQTKKTSKPFSSRTAKQVKEEAVPVSTTPVSTVSDSDPFAEWDRAAAKAGAPQRSVQTVPSASVQKPVSNPVYEEPKASSVDDEFDLESILNEFK